MATEPQNTSIGLYKKADPELQLRFVRQDKHYNNLVIPGHSAGGAVEGYQITGKENLKVVIDPHLSGQGQQKKLVDLAELPVAAIARARDIGKQEARGSGDAINTRRNTAGIAMELLANAQQQIADSAVAPLPAAPVAANGLRHSVSFEVPSFGTIPVRYDVVSIQEGNLVLGVRDELVSATFLPGESIEQPIRFLFEEQSRIAHTTPIRYSVDGITYVVLLLEG